MYDKLVAKISNIDTTGSVLKSKNDADMLDLENKIPDTSGLVKKSDYNNKITEIEFKILFISSALTAVEDEISNLSNLVEKRDYGTKFTEIEKSLLIMIMIKI